MPAKRFSKVDFPEPLGPIRARKSPFSISRLTRSSATTSNPSRAKRLLTFRTWTIVSGMLLFLYLRRGKQIRAWAISRPRLQCRSDSLIGYLHAISVAQLVHPGDRGRLATAQAFHNMVEIASEVTHANNSLLDAVALHHKHKIAAISVHDRGLRHQHACGRPPVFRPNRVGQKVDSGIHFRPQLLIRAFHLYFYLHGRLGS